MSGNKLSGSFSSTTNRSDSSTVNDTNTNGAATDIGTTMGTDSAVGITAFGPSAYLHVILYWPGKVKTNLRAGRRRVYFKPESH
jgi:hypothetical protein